MITTSNYQTQSEDTDTISEMILFDLWRSWNTTKKAIHLHPNNHNTCTTTEHITQTNTKTQPIKYFFKKVLY
jgi:hypothetical protein